MSVVVQVGHTVSLSQKSTFRTLSYRYYPLKHMKRHPADYYAKYKKENNRIYIAVLGNFRWRLVRYNFLKHSPAYLRSLTVWNVSLEFTGFSSIRQGFTLKIVKDTHPIDRPSAMPFTNAPSEWLASCLDLQCNSCIADDNYCYWQQEHNHQ